LAEVVLQASFRFEPQFAAVPTLACIRTRRLVGEPGGIALRALCFFFALWSRLVLCFGSLFWSSGFFEFFSPARSPGRHARRLSAYTEAIEAADGFPVAVDSAIAGASMMGRAVFGSASGLVCVEPATVGLVGNESIIVRLACADMASCNRGEDKLALQNMRCKNKKGLANSPSLICYIFGCGGRI
jgi:hypothetical protein